MLDQSDTPFKKNSKFFLTFFLYSKENPWIVLQNYDYKKTMGKIVGSIMIPNVIFAVSLLILLYWYCPYCQARCKRYEDQINQDDKEQE